MARVRDPDTGGCLPALTGHAKVACGVALSPDGRLLATASSGKTAQLRA